MSRHTELAAEALRSECHEARWSHPHDPYDALPDLKQVVAALSTIIARCPLPSVLASRSDDAAGLDEYDERWKHNRAAFEATVEAAYRSLDALHSIAGHLVP